MFWWIFIGISALLVILGIVLGIYGLNSYHEWVGYIGVVISVIFGIAFILTIIITPIQKICLAQKVEVFKQQKYYIEEIVPTLPETDNFALTQKRIELNEWLYNAKYEVEHYSFFTLYSDEVLKLEEIK
jgi:hypothetical protein